MSSSSATTPGSNNTTANVALELQVGSQETTVSTHNIAISTSSLAVNTNTSTSGTTTTNTISIDMVWGTF